MIGCSYTYDQAWALQGQALSEFPDSHQPDQSLVHGLPTAAHGPPHLDYLLALGQLQLQAPGLSPQFL